MKKLFKVVLVLVLALSLVACNKGKDKNYGSDAIGYFTLSSDWALLKGDKSTEIDIFYEDAKKNVNAYISVWVEDDFNPKLEEFSPEYISSVDVQDRANELGLSVDDFKLDTLENDFGKINYFSFDYPDEKTPKGTYKGYFTNFWQRDGVVVYLSCLGEAEDAEKLFFDILNSYRLDK